MRYLALLALFAAPASAQEYVLRLNAQEMAVVGTALDAMPYRQAAPVISVIQKQLETQLQAQAAKEKPDAQQQPKASPDHGGGSPQP